MATEAELQLERQLEEARKELELKDQIIDNWKVNYNRARAKTSQPHCRTEILESMGLSTEDHINPVFINFVSNNFLDEEGKPAGGVAFGPGFTIAWQRGALVSPTGDRRDQNGAFGETVIGALLDHYHFFQTTPFICEENQQVIKCLEEALRVIQSRTMTRFKRGVEGTHTV